LKANFLEKDIIKVIRKKEKALKGGKKADFRDRRKSGTQSTIVDPKYKLAQKISKVEASK
jgi:hypothetical protein